MLSLIFRVGYSLAPKLPGSHGRSKAEARQEKEKEKRRNQRGREKENGGEEKNVRKICLQRKTRKAIP